uniref:ATP-dependent (S)-NAD(P)H-hydrate dehydratase n=1 Tax=Angiostrongylus costaricensis TaxID=334426 RepID=A0A0R3PX86_ANGCS
LILERLTIIDLKGSCGKLGVIGGSIEYTGAPFFAAISALKLGADIVHVMCAPEAVSSIKSYSPELIVCPGLDPDRLLERMDAVVLGPGLGRSSQVFPLFNAVLDFVKRTNVPFIVDADGLWFLCESLREGNVPSLQSAMLTPNIVEFSRLCEYALGIRDVLTIKDQNELRSLATRLSCHLGTSLFLKGRVDIITNPDGNVVIGDEDGCPRRCGGQGDVTSGTLAMFLLWASRYRGDIDALFFSEAKLAAGLASSQLVRRCGNMAFSSIGRSMVTTDIINNIPSVLREIDEGK